jgi:hypothetical protein
MKALMQLPMKTTVVLSGGAIVALTQCVVMVTGTDFAF